MTGNILESSDQLVVAESERGGEVAVHGGECCHQLTIARGGGGQVCNAVDSFLFIYLVGGLVVNKICGVVSSTRGSGLQLAQFLVGGCKKYLEFGPGLVGWIPYFPLLSVVGEHTSLKYQLICDADNLQRSVRGIPSRGVLDDVFNFVD